MKIYIHTIFNSLVLTLLLTVLSTAQTGTAQLSGNVADAQGSLVAGASVKIYERDNRIQATAVTDEKGSFNFPRLAAGEYVLEIEAAGFTPVSQKIQVAAGKNENLNVSLAVSAISAEVVVTASGTGAVGGRSF
jgi:uncharacterized surface anchored protein